MRDDDAGEDGSTSLLGEVAKALHGTIAAHEREQLLSCPCSFFSLSCSNNGLVFRSARNTSYERTGMRNRHLPVPRGQLRAHSRLQIRAGHSRRQHGPVQRLRPPGWHGARCRRVSGLDFRWVWSRSLQPATGRSKVSLEVLPSTPGRGRHRLADMRVRQDPRFSVVLRRQRRRRDGAVHLIVT